MGWRIWILLVLGPSLAGAVEVGVREIFSKRNCWFSFKCISGQANLDQMYKWNNIQTKKNKQKKSIHRPGNYFDLMRSLSLLLTHSKIFWCPHNSKNTQICRINTVLREKCNVTLWNTIKMIKKKRNTNSIWQFV